MVNWVNVVLVVLQCVNSDVEIPIYLMFQVGLKRSVELIDCAIYVMMGWWEMTHYILKCKALCIERKRYIQEIYINKPSIAVMYKLLNSCDVKILSNMVKCIIIIIINAKFA